MGTASGELWQEPVFWFPVSNGKVRKVVLNNFRETVTEFGVNEQGRCWPQGVELMEGGKTLKKHISVRLFAVFRIGIILGNTVSPGSARVQRSKNENIENKRLPLRGRGISFDWPPPAPFTPAFTAVTLQRMHLAPQCPHEIIIPSI